jgi:hypothetical protein
MILSAKIDIIKKLWADIALVVQMDVPEQLSRFLGCTYERRTITVNSKPAVEIRMNMNEFVASADERYVELAEKYTGATPRLKKVGSPFRPKKAAPLEPPPAT